ncbi:alpha/beta hydrolase [Variovorax paradoxus]|uniref:alpha/beta hydrolase n=1 Tax=Variovorax paradoxus TaxID=34073 RepID=UPI00193332A7|nr:alpha/beta hydrolase [Variovorax paradoxus]
MSAPLDPELAAIVAAMRANKAPPPFSGTPGEARERMRRAVMAARERTTLPVVASTEDRVAEHEGLRVPVRIYRPVSTEAVLPTLVFLHGGGFALGSVELMDDIARKLCRDVEAVVVSVDYRLAPEHPFPAAHDDALAATRWALDQAEMLGGDPSRVALAGESAGANLAACAALALRGHTRPLAAQLLVVPGLDMARDVAAIEARGIDYPMLAPADLREIARLSMGTLAHRAAEVPPSPLRAANVADLPPTLIAVAGHDPLREEGLAYAHRLEAAGVPTRLLAFDDMFHPFFGFFAHSAAAGRAHDAICQALSDRLRRRG